MLWQVGRPAVININTLLLQEWLEIFEPNLVRVGLDLYLDALVDFYTILRHFACAILLQVKFNMEAAAIFNFCL